MPQIHIRLSEDLIDGLDELRWDERAESRTSLVVMLLSLLVPPFQPRLLAGFVCQHFSDDEIDVLVAEIVRR